MSRNQLQPSFVERSKTMKSLALNSDADARWGIERWENEGGRVRSGKTVSNGLNLPPDKWTRDRPTISVLRA